jgi:putative ABC transport system substrate-binding protein
VRRREFITLLGGATFAGSLVARAQQTGKAYRIGYLAQGSSAINVDVTEVFRQRLRELGWVEGQNITIDYRFADGQSDQLADFAAELARLKVDIIVASPTVGVVAAKNATGTIPIVAISVGDPVALGLIASLARPGGNITGLSYGVGVDTLGKSLELLKETLPNIGRVAVLSNPANPFHAFAITNVKIAAQALRVELQLLEARVPDEFDGAFAAIAKERVGALLVLADGLFSLHRTRLVALEARNRLPSMYGNRVYAEAGGLMSYGPYFPDLWQRAASYVDKILRGAKPSDLPVEQPNKFELVINLKTAKALGLTVPPSLLARADELIE